MKKLVLFLLTLTLLATTDSLRAQGTAFTYQGQLQDNGSPANGSYDFQFMVFDNSAGGAQQGPTLATNSTAVSNGLFSVTLDFGSVFPGAHRWLDISVRTNGGSLFNELSPRQALTPAPYAITAGGVAPGAGLSGTYGGAVTLSNAANSFTGAFTGNGANVTNVNAATVGGLSPANFWQLTGNNAVGGQFLGSTNNQPVEIRANNQTMMRFAYASNATDGFSPNLIGGSSSNYVGNGVVGATIMGGGNSIVGDANLVSADFGTVLGGLGNLAAGLYSIAGGSGSTAIGAYSTALGDAVAIGDLSFATGNDSHATGNSSTALGAGYASGETAVALGASEADGDFSLAAGRGIAANDGCFVWSDDSDVFNDFVSTAANQFLIRAVGGVGIGTNGPAAQLHVASSSGSPQVQITQNNASDYVRLRMNSTGSPFWEMDVSPGSSPSISFWNVSERMVIDYSGNVSAKTFTPSSDRNLKENFKPVSPREVLDKVSALPITQWNFKDEATPHIGPMAQDFYAAFALGMDDKHIATVDEDGVALAAIQGLNQKLSEKDLEIQKLQEKVEKMESLEKRLCELEKTVESISVKK